MERVAAMANVARTVGRRRMGKTVHKSKNQSEPLFHPDIDSLYGLAGKPGSEGKPGKPGGDGPNAGKVTIDVLGACSDNVTVVHGPPSAPTQTLKIPLSEGQKPPHILVRFPGGQGGKGGNGGRGGNGEFSLFNSPWVRTTLNLLPWQEEAEGTEAVIGMRMATAETARTELMEQMGRYPCKPGSDLYSRSVLALSLELRTVIPSRRTAGMVGMVEKC